MSTSFDTLPRETWVHIFSYLNPQDLASVAKTCTLFNEAGSDPLLWRPYLINQALYRPYLNPPLPFDYIEHHACSQNVKEEAIKATRSFCDFLLKNNPGLKSTIPPNISLFPLKDFLLTQLMKPHQDGEEARQKILADSLEKACLEDDAESLVLPLIKAGAYTSITALFTAFEKKLPPHVLRLLCQHYGGEKLNSYQTLHFITLSIHYPSEMTVPVELFFHEN